MSRIVYAQPGERVQIRFRDDATWFSCSGVIVDISQEPLEVLDVTNFGSPLAYYYPEPARLKIQAVVTPEPQYYYTQEQLLARAVLSGEKEAALVLADEVQQQYLAGENFVSRESLLALLSRAYRAIKPTLDDPLASEIYRVLWKCNVQPEVLTPQPLPPGHLDEDDLDH